MENSTVSLAVWTSTETPLVVAAVSLTRWQITPFVNTLQWLTSGTGTLVPYRYILYFLLVTIHMLSPWEGWLASYRPLNPWKTFSARDSTISLRRKYRTVKTKQYSFLYPNFPPFIIFTYPTHPRLNLLIFSLFIKTTPYFHYVQPTSITHYIPSFHYIAHAISSSTTVAKASTGDGFAARVNARQKQKLLATFQQARAAELS